MKWIIALNEPSPEYEEFGKRYEHFAKIAVFSAKMHAPNLTPILIYNGRSSPFTVTMEQLGVKVLHHRLSFQDSIDAAPNRDSLWRQTAKGAMLRLDIPSIINSGETVLYTDTDIFFLDDPTKYLLKTKCIAVAPEFDINNFGKINTGSMLINLAAAREKFKELIEWLLPKLSIIPDYDQGAIQQFFNGDWDPLHPALNWKPYWGINDSAILLHFHGPKPNNFNPLTLQPVQVEGIYKALYDANPTAYRHYLAKWVALNHKYAFSGNEVQQANNA